MSNYLTLTTAKKLGLKESTLLSYQTLTERIIRRTRAYLQDSPEDVINPTPADLIHNWERKSESGTYSTAAIERSALMWHLSSAKPKGWEDAIATLKNRIPKRSDFNANSDRISTKRSRAPGRMIPEAHLKTLIQHLTTLRTTGEATGQQAQWFLLAGIASGARPIEWRTAKWVDEPNGVLRIFTAKVKSRNAWDKIPPMTFTAEDLDNEMEGITEHPTQGNGENSWYAVDFSRRISGINLTAEELKELHDARYLNGVELFRDVQIERHRKLYVTLHMQSVQACLERELKLQLNWPVEERQSADVIFNKKYFDRIRHCIWRSCTVIFNGDAMYSLYDTRSTFSANRKGMVGGLEAARELGHSVTTSRSFYAPASKAWAAYKPVHGNSTAASAVQGQVDAAVGIQPTLAGMPN